MLMQLLLDGGLVPSFVSFDGSPFAEEMSSGQVSFLDLTIPVYGLKTFDWVMSLEVSSLTLPSLDLAIPVYGLRMFDWVRS